MYNYMIELWEMDHFLGGWQRVPNPSGKEVDGVNTAWILFNPTETGRKVMGYFKTPQEAEAFAKELDNDPETT